jgi:prepilin-type N-terminal cleavage/methylation domain-containing protein
MKSRSGFTLIEVLIVIGILGIVLALGVGLLGDPAVRTLKEAQAQFASDVEKARNAARRYNVSYKTTLNLTEYSFEPVDLNGVNVSSAPTISGKLPTGTSVEYGNGNPATNIYRAPFARAGSGGAPTSKFQPDCCQYCGRHGKGD